MFHRELNIIFFPNFENSGSVGPVEQQIKLEWPNFDKKNRTFRLYIESLPSNFNLIVLKHVFVKNVRKVRKQMYYLLGFCLQR